MRGETLCRNVYFEFEIEKIREFSKVACYFLCKGRIASAEHEGARVEFFSLHIIDILDKTILYYIGLSCVLLDFEQHYPTPVLPAVTIQTVFRHCQMSARGWDWGQNRPWLGITGLERVGEMGKV